MHWAASQVCNPGVSFGGEALARKCLTICCCTTMPTTPDNTYVAYACIYAIHLVIKCHLRFLVTCASSREEHLQTCSLHYRHPAAQGHFLLLPVTALSAHRR